MNILRQNLYQLEGQFFCATGARSALDHLEQARRGHLDLDTLLRNHVDDGKGITDELEVTQRDEFDDLLHYFAVLEIACLLGVVPRNLPQEIVSRARAVLKNRAVRRYYRTHYKLLLPELFRRRVSGSGLRITRPKAAVTSASLAAFLDIAALVEQNEDVETFLWMLDDGWYGDVGLADLVDHLRDARKLGRSLVTKRPTPLDRAVRGFGRYITFCCTLDALLQRVERWPELQSAFWHYHAYWFEFLRTKTGSALDQMVAALSTSSGEEGSGALAHVAQVRGVIFRLTDGHYGAALRAAARV